MGCTLVQDCYTNSCPAGLTGSYEKLNIQSSVKQIVNYIKGTRIEIQNIVGSIGKKRIQISTKGILSLLMKYLIWYQDCPQPIGITMVG